MNYPKERSPGYVAMVKDVDRDFRQLWVNAVDGRGWVYYQQHPIMATISVYRDGWTSVLNPGIPELIALLNEGFMVFNSHSRDIALQQGVDEPPAPNTGFPSLLGHKD